MSEQTVTWNTGRKYSAAGQRISAVVSLYGWIAFVDHDRMIDGIVRGGHHGDLSESEIRDRVMTAYDNNLYDYPRENREYEAIGLARAACYEPKG